MHRKVAAALVAAFAVGLAGCGGTETRTLKRAALVRQVELACREVQREVRAYQREAGRSANPVETIRAGQEFLVGELDELEGAGAARADFARFKEAVKARFDGIDEIAAASDAERDRVLRSLQPEIERASRAIGTATRNLGIEGCG
jgi:hypothetical protein